MAPSGRIDAIFAPLGRGRRRSPSRERATAFSSYICRIECSTATTARTDDSRAPAIDADARHRLTDTDPASARLMDKAL